MMCILHADFHQMEAECWAAVVEWYFRDGVIEPGYRDRYQAAVEREMLHQVVDIPDPCWCEGGSRYCGC